jgi:hypothetical protein
VATIKTGALVVSWGPAIPGRERRMLEVLRQVLRYADGLVADGTVTEALFFVAKTGPNRDTLMLRGDLETLAALLASDELEAHRQDGMLVVQDVELALWAGGDPRGVSDGIAEHAAKLGAHELV